MPIKEYDERKKMSRQKGGRGGKFYVTAEEIRRAGMDPTKDVWFTAAGSTAPTRAERRKGQTGKRHRLLLSLYSNEKEEKAPAAEATESVADGPSVMEAA